MNARVLVVEDETDIAELLAYNFGAAGYQVRTAPDGSAGVREAVAWLPQAIILDLNLPYLDGISVCEILRHNPHTQSIPILMLTAWLSSEAKAIGRAVGANDYLTKPFSPQEVVRRTGWLIEQAGARTVAA